MNSQTYENCIATLENQIKSRESERKSMQSTINQIDHHLQIQISKNQSLQNQLIHLAQTNQNIIADIHALQTILQEKDHIIQNHAALDQGRKMYITALETQKSSLIQKINQKDTQINQINTQLLSSQNQLNTALLELEGYKTQVSAKNTEIEQIGRQFKNCQEQCAILNQKLVQALKQQQISKEQGVEKIRQYEQNFCSLKEELEAKIKQLQNRFEETTEYYKEQVATLQFNKQCQIINLNKNIQLLQFKISAQEAQIAHLKEEQKKVKSHYDVQIETNDKVLNTLINQINFLKQEKVQLKKITSQQVEQTAQQLLILGLELAEKESNAKAKQNQIKALKDEIHRKDHQISALNKQIQKTNLQIQITKNQLLSQKNTIQKKHQEILQLKRFIDNLKKFAEVADKDKENISKKTNKQIQNLKNLNSQLQQSLKILHLQKTSLSSIITELESSIKTHEYTIEKLQAMLEQSKKVVVDLNKLMKTKITEIETLEMSNNLFRKEKLDWILKQENYRKRISEYRAAQSASKRLDLSEMSFMSRTTRKSMIESSKVETLHMDVVNSVDNQTGLNPSGLALISAMKRKTLPVQGSDKFAYLCNQEENCAGLSDTPESEPASDAKEATFAGSNAFKKSQELKIKIKPTELTEFPTERPAIPVLSILRKKENERNRHLEGQDSVEKEWESREDVSTRNGLDALKRPLSDRQSFSNREIGVEPIEEENNSAASESSHPANSSKQNSDESEVESSIKSSNESLIEENQEYGLREGEKYVSSETHPESPIGGLQSIEPTIQAKSQNLTPEFHAQPEEFQTQTQKVEQKQEFEQKKEVADEQDPTFGYQTLEEYEIEQRLSTQRSVSISRKKIQEQLQSDPLIEILQDDELNELNEASQLNAIKERDHSPSNHQESYTLSGNGQEQNDSQDDQDTVDGINILLDRINTQ